ncbi:MAG: hypothetical protein GY780_08975 [bacterium]|nr:hypothetical protein [bacterium]
MKKTTILVALVLAITAGSVQAQSYYNRDHGLYLELFGTGGELSLNYERIIENKVAIRAGIGATGVAFRKGYAVPFSISGLLGANQNYFEVGIGGSFIDFKEDSTEDAYLNITERQVVTNAIVGYRYLSDYGFTFRLAFTPAYTKDGFEPMGGAMMGKTW